jgi:hypothetical protein
MNLKRSKGPYSVIALAAAILFVPEAGAEDVPNRPNYRTIEPKTSQPPSRQLYKTVDEKGRVIYSDAPKDAAQKGAKIGSVNVASPEARRQLQIELQDKQREEQAERNAAMRRSAPIRQREAEEAAKKRREDEAQNPSYAPRPVRIVQ